MVTLLVFLPHWAQIIEFDVRRGEARSEAGSSAVQARQNERLLCIPRFSTYERMQYMQPEMFFSCKVFMSNLRGLDL